MINFVLLLFYNLNASVKFKSEGISSVNNFLISLILSIKNKTLEWVF